MADPELIAEADHASIEINPLSGKEVDELVTKVFRDTSKTLAKKVTDIIAAQ